MKLTESGRITFFRRGAFWSRGSDCDAGDVPCDAAGYSHRPRRANILNAVTGSKRVSSATELLFRLASMHVPSLGLRTSLVFFFMCLVRYGHVEQRHPWLLLYISIYSLDTGPI